jgi:hypothetical protein
VIGQKFIAQNTMNSAYMIDTINIIKKAYNICIQEYFNDNNITVPSEEDWKKVTDSMYCSFKFLKQKGFENTCFFYIDMEAAKILRIFNNKGISDAKYNFFSKVLYDKMYFACLNNGQLFKLSGFFGNQCIEFFENVFLLEDYHFLIQKDKYYKRRVMKKYLPFYKSLKRKYYVEELDIVGMIKYFKSTWTNKNFNSFKRPEYPYLIW